MKDRVDRLGCSGPVYYIFVMYVCKGMKHITALFINSNLKPRRFNHPRHHGVRVLSKRIAFVAGKNKEKGRLLPIGDYYK